MFTRHVHHQLSAYIDGETRYANRIAAHLLTCEECARHHDELLELSRRMHMLPFPEVRPEFTTRVMAFVRETDPARRVLVRPWLPVAVAGASILILLAGMYAVQDGNSDRSAASSSHSNLNGWVPIGPSELASGETADDDWLTFDAADVEGWPADIVAPLGDAAWNTPLVESWGPREDLDAMLLHLDDEEQENFRALLWLYAQESDVI